MPNKKRTVLVIALWMGVLLWCAVIWSFSAQNGATSERLSESISAQVTKTVLPIDAELFNRLIRKLAHMAEYAVLAGLLYAALTVSGGKKPTVIAAALCLIAAASDELHQLFVADRAGRFSDVLIDLGGAMIGLLLIWLIRRWKR